MLKKKKLPGLSRKKIEWLKLEPTYDDSNTEWAHVPTGYTLIHKKTGEWELNTDLRLVLKNDAHLQKWLRQEGILS